MRIVHSCRYIKDLYDEFPWFLFFLFFLPDAFNIFMDVPDLRLYAAGIFSRVTLVYYC